MRLILTLALLASPLAAQDIVAPSDVLERLRGTTLAYDADGVVVGVERFREDDTVTVQHLDGSCLDGEVYVSGDELCFRYEDEAEGEEHCWWSVEIDGDLYMRLADLDRSMTLRTQRVPDRPFQCRDPNMV
ncbi:hypothetical protein [Roseobacter sp. HKCCA0434]|uniref:hypothetical protein n=1 Tax=Roseobacter sp. HKCCA0434 TaxID=3079297 RepID=UPI00290583FD|nr:hypothetical protein [Roseobacter sp. HKCCA0434]